MGALLIGLDEWKIFEILEQWSLGEWCNIPKKIKIKKFAI